MTVPTPKRAKGKARKERRVKMIVDCYDCGEPYGSPRFQDLIIPLDIWERISPTSDEGGLLCPNCICARLSAAGISDCPAAFFSGPIRTVDRVTMEAYRRAENAWRRLVAEEGE